MDRNSEELMDRFDVVCRWRMYFNDLLNFDEPSSTHTIQVNALDTADNYVLEPTIQEIEEAIKKLRNGKSIGKEEKAAELLKSGGQELCKMIHVLVLKVWKEE